MSFQSTWQNRFGVVVAAYLGACLLLGGASAAGVLANLLLQLLAIGLLLWVFARLGDSKIDGLAKAAIWLVLAVAALPLAQLVPLPSDVWSALPGRDAIVGDYQRLGLPLPSLGISLSPERTIASWLTLLPPIAMFLATLTLVERERLVMVYVVVGFAIVSILVGFLQVTSSSTGFYFYKVSNFGSAVGFFSNRNHLASLLLMVLPLLTLLLRSAGSVDLPSTSLFGRRILVAGFVFILSVGIFFTGSRAGLALLVPVLGLTYIAMLRTSRGFTPQVMLIGFVGLVLLVTAAFSYSPFYERIVERSENFRSDVRYWTAPITSQSALDNFPFGTGLGTFDSVFRRAAGDLNLGPNFVNHAHNDYLELALTGGLPAILLIVAGLVWVGAAARTNWRMKSGNPSALSRASSVIIFVAILHSSVDYPLRSAALAALFAAACAFQLAPLVSRRAASPEAAPAPRRRPFELADMRVAAASRAKRR